MIELFILNIMENKCRSTTPKIIFIVKNLIEIGMENPILKSLFTGSSFYLIN